MAHISRSKDNQAMKFDRLIEYNVKHFFLKTYAQNTVEKLFPDPFLKVKVEHIPGSIV